MGEVDESGPNYRVRALLRGLALLSCFGPTTHELTLSELAERAGLDKVTALRLLDCLVYERFLYRDPQRGSYRVGARVLEVGAGYRAPLALVEVADGPLHELARASNQTAALGIMDQGDLLQVAVAIPERALRRHTIVGERFPFHCTSLGKALVASLDEAAIDALIAEKGLPALTGRTLVDRDALLADLRATRARGFAFDDEEYAEGVRCMAAVIRDFAARPVAAINISGPAAEFAGEHFQHYGDLVQTTAARISRRLGYQPAAVAASGAGA